MIVSVSEFATASIVDKTVNGRFDVVGLRERDNEECNGIDSSRKIVQELGGNKILSTQLLTTTAVHVNLALHLHHA